MEGFTVKTLRDYLNSLEDKDDYTIEDIKNMKMGYVFHQLFRFVYVKILNKYVL